MSDLANLDGRPVQGGPSLPVTVMNTIAAIITSISQTINVAVMALRGAANMANGQVTTSTTAATAVAARATRRSVTIKNTDTSITVYIGIATVTSSNGMPLKAGESISIDTTALVQVIAASGTPVVAYVETYD